MTTNALAYVPIESLVVPRSKLRDVQKERPEYADLLLSVQKWGILEPLAVRPHEDEGKFLIVNGLQRYSCALTCGLKEVPIHNLDLGNDTDALIISVVMNLQQIQTPPYQYAQALRKVIRKRPDLSLAELARLVGKPDQWVRDRLSLSKLTVAVGEEVDEGRVPLKAAQGLTLLKPEDQVEMVKQVGALPTDDFYKKCVTASRESKITPHDTKSDEDRFDKFVANSALRRKKAIEDELELKRNFYLLRNEGCLDAEPGEDSLLAVWLTAIKWVLQIDPKSIEERREKYERKMDRVKANDG
jgi:ParB/RepB/Spo0J family partition protein